VQGISLSKLSMVKNRRTNIINKKYSERLAVFFLHTD